MTEDTRRRRPRPRGILSPFSTHVFVLTLAILPTFLSATAFSFDQPCKPLRFESPDHAKALELIVDTARKNHSRISIRGAGYSQGNQTCADDFIQISLGEMNQLMTLDIENKLVTVQAGMTWKRLQEQLVPFGLAVSAMQSYNDFSIGGSLSVNAHGQDIHWNPVAETVESVKVLLTDGQHIYASREENPDLFKSVLGSYGLIGIITEVTLKVVSDNMLKKRKQLVATRNYKKLFFNTLQPNNSLALHSARLSINPLYRFRNMVVISYFDSGELAPPPSQLEPPALPDASLLNYMKTSWLARVFRTTFEYFFVESNSCMSRNQAMGESVISLNNKVESTKDILQEYFIPPEKLETFIAELRAWTSRLSPAKLLNATVRWVNADKTTLLAYAPEDRFAVVLFFNLPDNEDAMSEMEKATRELIEITLKLGGRYYLPYALFASPKQLHQAYPEFQTLLKKKKKYDAQELLTNELYQKYGNRTRFQ